MKSPRGQKLCGYLTNARRELCICHGTKCCNFFPCCSPFGPISCFCLAAGCGDGSSCDESGRLPFRLAVQTDRLTAAGALLDSPLSDPPSSAVRPSVRPRIDPTRPLSPPAASADRSSRISLSPCPTAGSPVPSRRRHGSTRQRGTAHACTRTRLAQRCTATGGGERDAGEGTDPAAQPPAPLPHRHVDSHAIPSAL